MVEVTHYFQFITSFTSSLEICIITPVVWYY